MILQDPYATTNKVWNKDINTADSGNSVLECAPSTLENQTFEMLPYCKSLHKLTKYASPSG